MSNSGNLFREVVERDSTDRDRRLVDSEVVERQRSQRSLLLM